MSETTDSTEPVTMMSHSVGVEYAVAAPTPLALRFAAVVAEGRIIGHRCDSCGKVYVPPRGYCGLCVIPTATEVDVASTGTVTSFTVITPIQYHGQEETEDYAQANVLLDGADQTMMTRLDGVPLAEVRMGLRLEVAWKPADERSGTSGLADAAAGWRVTGEPDTPLDAFAEHIL